MKIEIGPARLAASAFAAAALAMSGWRVSSLAGSAAASVFTAGFCASAGLAGSLGLVSLFASAGLDPSGLDPSGLDASALTVVFAGLAFASLPAAAFGRARSTVASSLAANEVSDM